jgi:CheY-like chemotaxis protein
MQKVALVVEDSMLMRYAVCRLLEERGFAVESASNGAEALEVLACVQPALIITDLQMPKMSGSELITALKGNPETARIPVIVVAGRTRDFDEKRADVTIYKDVDIDEQLGKALDQLLGKAAREHKAGK